jgi:hypothetical protein
MATRDCDITCVGDVNCLPDLMRYTLTRSLASETDQDKALMLRAVLEGYDAGLINGQISILDACVKWTSAEIN